MFDQESHHGEDPLKVGKGIALGIVLGSILWTIIIGCVYYAFYLD